MANHKDTTKIKGLSGATVELLTYSDGKQVVKKSAIGKYREKLLNEIRWYQNIDKIAQNIFPNIELVKITDDSVEFIMPFYYDGNIFENVYIGREENIKTIISFFTALTYKLYLPTLHNNKNVFIDTFLKEKLLKRMDLIKSIDFSNNIIINGKNLKSLNDLLKTLMGSDLFISIKENTQLCKTHGDLTLRNILVDPKNDNEFIFIDVNPKDFITNYFADPIEDVSRITAYIYPVLPMKNNNIYWEQDGGNIFYMSQILSTQNTKKMLKVYCLI